MTTIIAARTALYADSYCNSAHPFGTTKLHRVVHEQSGAIYLMGGAGYLSDLEFFARLLAQCGLNDMWKLHLGEHWPPKIMKAFDTDILVVTEDRKIYLVDKTLLPMAVNEKFYCIGSGGDWARAALDFGKTYEEAIEYAASRDDNTRAPVHKLTFGRKPAVE